MKKIILILVSSIAFFSCTTNEEYKNSTSNSLKEITTNDGDQIVEMYTTEYIFDNEGKVVKEINTNLYYPEYNYTNTFEYDTQGRVIKEIRNNELISNVVWIGNNAKIFGSTIDLNNNNVATYNFSNGKVTSISSNGTILHKFNYDQNDNVISEVQADTVFVEYLDYDTTVNNPMQLIKSIGILRMHKKPYFKNFFQTKKNYPEVNDDYSTPIQYFQFERFVDSENRIIKIDNEENHYITKFEYN